MPLNNLVVFNKEIYKAAFYGVVENINLFNEATDGCIMLSHAGAENLGDYVRHTYYNTLDLVRSRNAYATTSIANVTPSMGVASNVKIGRGTKELLWDRSDFKWIQQDDSVMRRVIGEMLAEQIVRNMLQTGIGAAVAAMSAQSSIRNLVDQTPSWSNLWDTAIKRGDKFDDIKVWVMHSLTYSALYKSNLANQQQLFNYSSVKVMQTPDGKKIVITDIPALYVPPVPPDGEDPGSPAKYWALGLCPGAINVEMNNDYQDNETSLNGYEQIRRSWQAEWSIQLSLPNFTWDESNGGHSPSDAALFTSSNWDPINNTSPKYYRGVIGRFL